MARWPAMVLSRVISVTFLWCSLCVGHCGCESRDSTPQQDLDLDAQIQRYRSANSRELIVRGIVDDGDLRRVAGLSELQVLELYSARVSSAGIAESISQLSHLKRLRLEDCDIDDDAVFSICGLQNLELLNLPNGTFTDVGLTAIAKLPKLELLRFSSPHVTDAGLAELASVKNLRFIHLLHVPITDSGLKTFHGMTQLESLYIDGGRETEDGIWQLLKANPDLHFHRNQLHLDNDPNADSH